MKYHLGKIKCLKVCEVNSEDFVFETRACFLHLLLLMPVIMLCFELFRSFLLLNYFELRFLVSDVIQVILYVDDIPLQFNSRHHRQLIMYDSLNKIPACNNSNLQIQPGIKYFNLRVKLDQIFKCYRFLQKNLYKLYSI